MKFCARNSINSNVLSFPTGMTLSFKFKCHKGNYDANKILGKILFQYNILLRIIWFANKTRKNETIIYYQKRK